MKNILITAVALAITCASAHGAENRHGWKFAHALYADTKARDVGDLVTVLIVESSSSSREASLKTEKTSGMKGSVSFFHPRIDNRGTSWTNAVIPEWGVDTERKYEGSGEMSSEDKITATMTVRVQEVLPNGNLLIEGQRSLSMQGEKVGYILTGTIRPYDITRENTVKSTSIADLNVQYFGKGAVARNQQKGLFTRFWDWVNPF